MSERDHRRLSALPAWRILIWACPYKNSIRIIAAHTMLLNPHIRQRNDTRDADHQRGGTPFPSLY